MDLSTSLNELIAFIPCYQHIIIEFTVCDFFPHVSIMCSLFNALKYLTFWLSKYVKYCSGHGDCRNYFWWQNKSESVSNFQLTSSSASVIKSPYLIYFKYLDSHKSSVAHLKQDR